ncbi:scabin-related ADP-ribosyltransferase [Paraburkholderia aspalathi]|uniref:scabin-related ADP-ribosyltransferase n=1 Tax=Paraburkholderia aspalathi TaxID=1324617 RepID=UPI0038BCB88F
MTPVEQKKYASEKWYQDWLTTTTSLCTDLTRLNTDNPDYMRILWRTDREPLFRGSGFFDVTGRKPQEIFEHGFYPWKYDGTLKFPSGGGVAAKESALTNTGHDPWYVFQAVSGGGEGYVIDAPGGIDQDGSNRRPPIPLRNVTVFPGGIAAEHIKGAFLKDMARGGALTFLPNMRWSAGQPTENEFDLVISISSLWEGHPGSQVTTFPTGVPVGHIAQRYTKGANVILKLTGAHAGCWFVNGERRPKTDELILTGTDEMLSTVVVSASPTTSELCQAGAEHASVR